MKQFLLVCSISLGAIGCAATMEVDGYTLRSSMWESDEAKVRRRASFDLNCPGDELTLTVLDTFQRTDHYAGTVGVRGCDQQATYIDVDGNQTWVMDNATEQKPEHVR